MRLTQVKRRVSPLGFPMRYRIKREGTRDRLPALNSGTEERMPKLRVGLLVVAVSLLALACGAPEETPEDSGVTDGGVGGKDGGDDTDAGADAGNGDAGSGDAGDGGPNAFVTSTTGFNFVPTAGRFIENENDVAAFIARTEAEAAFICMGGDNDHAMARFPAPGGVPATGTWDAADGGHAAFRSRSGVVSGSEGFVTVTAASAARIAGTFGGTNLVHEFEGPVPGEFSGRFDVEQCPIFTATGDNQVNGYTGFQPTAARLYRSDSDYQIAVLDSDGCTVGPVSRYRHVVFNFKVDAANPVGSYPFDNFTAYGTFSGRTDQGFFTSHARGGTLEILAADLDAGIVEGQFSTWVHSGLRFPIPTSGRFKTTPCP